MRPIKFLRGVGAWVLAALAATMLLAGTAAAATPRWVTGWPYFQDNNGTPVVWYTTSPLYYTDPGDLSATVSHATADALVASAAAAWNNGMSSLTLAQGGALNEHVSSANVYLGSSGPVFPSDVQATNYLAKPIAVIYDADGSVTDTLLGGGASDPGNCRQSAVTESVDSIQTNGQIQHALIVLNGRCVNATAATQQEMKYRLVRAFGRVLGLGWSQLNDNVFTGVPLATSQQAQNWPVMHPIDIYCGPYAYQCMVNPFTLRTDDLASLISMYPVTTAGNGKTLSYTNATKMNGFINFANGQPMEGLLVSLRRFHFGPGYTDAADILSTVSGMSFQQNAGNPITPKTNTLGSSMGGTNPYWEGYYSMGWVPVPSTDYFDNFIVTTSAINPLYTGQYAVGPYPVSQVTPSGPPMTGTAYVVNTYFGARVDMTADGSSTQTAAAAPATCSATNDGTVYVPLAVTASGFWSDALCGFQHTAWSSVAVKAGRSLTMEVTAVDEQGYATTGKMLPVLGAWDIGDSTGALPTIASQAAALNASTLGMTNMIAATTTARTMRLVIADQRGDGRPDYGYNARVLYADAVSPASLPANGGVVTISGMGFKPGNTVTVNGMAANVTGWTSTAITLVAPAMTGAVAADVVVTDLSTGGQTRMTGALSYSGTSQPDVLTVVSKPADGGYVGSAGSPVFRVQVMLPDGVTAAPGVAVTLTSAKATFGACGGAGSCTVTTDGAGFVSSTVTPTAAGTVGLTAAVGASSVTATFVAVAIPVDQLSVTSLPSGTVYATLPATAPFGVRVVLPDGTTAAAGVAVVVAATNATLGGCSGLATCTMVADGAGRISTAVTPLAAGVVSLLATAGGGMVSASFGATALPADGLRVVTKPADGSYVGRVAGVRFGVQVMLGDGATPAAGVSVTVTASGGTLGACGAASCVLTADATGSVSTTVTPTAAGTVSLLAAAGGGTVAASFNAVAVPPDALTVVTKPAEGSYVGRVAATPFGVSVVLGDGSGAAAGVSVSVSATNATLGCGASNCVLTADAAGAVSITVTPSAAGVVGLTATAGGGTVSASFNAVAVPPDALHVVTKPADGSYVGSAAGIAFSVQALLGDTGLPASGATVTVSATNATLGCGGSTCALVAGAGGTVSTSVTPTVAGTVGLSASAGGGTVATSFTALPMPPDALRVMTAPADNTYTGSPAAAPFSVSVVLGDGVTPAAGVAATVTAVGATLGACGLATCTLTASVLGGVSTSVTATAAGTVTLTATAGGGTVSATFVAINSPDIVQVLSVPSDSSYVGRVAATPFAVQVSLGSVANAHTLHALVARPPAAGETVTMTAVGATLGACGLPTCVVTTDATGTASSTVTPVVPGPVSLLASAGGSTTSTSFTAATPPDVVRVTSTPANGSYANRTAGAAFAVQVMLGDGTTPAAGAAVTLTASGATLNVCGQATCTVNADASGTASSLVTPTAVGMVTLTASAGGGSATTSFSAAAVPPDTLHVVAQPANGSYIGRMATSPFTVQVLLGDTGGAASGASVVLTATNATLGACGLATCMLTADSAGNVSTTVTPVAVGTVTLNASAGGGIVSTSFTAAAVPPDSLHVVSQPANGSYVQRVATLPFAIQVMRGDTGAAAAGASVTISATNATFGICGLATCVLTADSAGNVSATVTPAAVGAVTLNAGAGGGTVSASFTAATVPPDSLHVVSQPADGSYVQRVATLPFGIQVMRGDTGAAAASASVTLAAVNATLGACGQSTCAVVADATGNVSSTVTPSAVGAVTVTASSGGGTATASFTAAAVPPDNLHVVAQPANGSFAQRVAATPFAVQALLGDTGAAAGGASVTVTTTNATLGACGGSTCVLTADASGSVSTSVTPTATGLVTLSASVGGGMVTASFTAAAVPADVLHVLSQPANGSYANRTASAPFKVQVLLGDTGAAAAGVSVTLTALNAALSACGASSCVLTADASGMVATSVTPTVAGAVSLTAAAGGGTATASFSSAAIPPDALQVVSQPMDGAYVSVPSSSRFTVQILLGDTGAPAAGASVTVSASNATFDVCGLAACVLVADGAGRISTLVTPTTVGAISITASAGGGSVTIAFNAAAQPVDVLHVTSQPTGGVYAGLAAAAPFTVQVLLPDGTTPASGASVVLSATNAALGSCAGNASCVLMANTAGVVSTSVTPQQAGSVSLHATAGGGSVAATLVALSLPPDVLTVTSVPASPVYVGTVAASRFALHVLLGDGVTPASGAAVTLTASGASLGACVANPCVLTADASGNVSTPVTPPAAGTVTLTASAGGESVSASFVVSPDVLRVVTSPASGSYPGSPATSPLAVQVLLGDGATPAPGTAVTLSAVNGSLGACAGTPCVLTADAQGMVSTSVTASAAGTVQLSATAGGGAASVTFTASAPPDVLVVQSAPANGAYVGRSAAMPFTVRVALGNAMNHLAHAMTAALPPAVGEVVTLTATGATLDACGATSCTLTSDASGLVSTMVTPTGVGSVGLAASAGGTTVSATFTAVPVVRTIVFTRSTEYVAAGATVAWIPAVTVLENGMPVAGQPIFWTGNAGLALSGTGSTTDGTGTATIGVTVGPLAAGAPVSGRACAWTNVCATFGAQGVDSSLWLLQAVSGDTQMVGANDSLQPLVVRAVDGMGNQIAGVSIAVHQTSRGWVTCPASGRCPTGPVLETANSTATSDADGLISVAPLQMAGTAETAQIVAAAGANGYLAVSLSKAP